MLDGPNEHELLLQAVAGDRASLERLLLLHYMPLSRRIAAKLPLMGQGVVAADDVLQQTFMQVFRDIRNFHPQTDASFQCWLNRIADYRAIDAVRSARRQKRGGDTTHLPSYLNADSIQDLIKTLSADGRSPSQSAAGHEAVQAIQIAITELPANQRRALQLHCLEGQSLEAVAAELQCTKDAVRGLVDRAKRHLRAALGRSSQWLSKE